jgi:hypothetical protein
MAARLEIGELVGMLEEATLSLGGSLSESTELAALEGWNSMGMVLFAGLVQDRTGVELAARDYPRDALSVGALLRAVQERIGRE